MANHIIVPLDGSRLSHAALPLARGLADRANANVTLVTVPERPNEIPERSRDETLAHANPGIDEGLSSQNAHLEDYLDQIAATFNDHAVDTAVRFGDTAREILDVAESKPNPAVVMASHGRTGLAQVLMGSNAAAIVQNAQCPVFVVRAAEDTKSEHGTMDIKQILVALDGSLVAERALAAVRRMFGNEVSIHLVMLTESTAPGQAYAAQSVVELEQETRGGAEAYLRRMAEELTDEGRTVTWEARDAEPAGAIKEIAEQIGVDLIAMTTRARTGVGRVMFGSTVEQVMQDTVLPLMIVRATDADDEPDNSQAPPLV